MDQTKACRRCEQTLPFDDFYFSRGRRRSTCKRCAVEQNRERIEKRRGEPVVRRHRHMRVDEHGKTCCTCETHKPLTEFYIRQATGKPGSDCKDCVKARMKAVREPDLTRAPKSYKDGDGKVCPKCQDYKLWELFKRPESDAYGTYCRACTLAVDRASKNRNRDEANRQRRERWAQPVTDFEASRRCPMCEQQKPVSEFAANGKAGYCKPCRITYARDWHRGNQDRAREQKYGWTPEEFAELQELQGGGCAICGTKRVVNGRWASENGHNLHVDHDHETGEVRGLLCNRCNVTLGLMDDDADRLVRAAEYLRKPPAIAALR